MCGCFCFIVVLLKISYFPELVLDDKVNYILRINEENIMKKNLPILLASMLVNMGIGLIMPITTLFLHNRLHQTLVTAGYVLMGFSLAMVLGNLLGGWLFDHWKVKPTHYLGGLLVWLNLTLLIIFPIWPLYTILVIGYGFGLGILNSAVNGYIAAHQKKSPNLFTNAYWLANLGMGLATFLSGILYALNIRWVFSVALFIFIITLLVVKIFFHEISHSTIAVRATTSWKSKLQLPSGLWFVCLLLVVIWIGYEQWNSNVSVYMLQQGISVQKYSLLFTISTFEIVIFQPLLNLFFRPTFTNEKYRIIGGTLLFGASYLSLINASHYSQFLLGITLLSFGDMLTLTTTPAMINRFATDQNRATIQALGGTAGSLGRALGPLLGGIMIQYWHYQITFIVLFAFHIGFCLFGNWLLHPEQSLKKANDSD